MAATAPAPVFGKIMSARLDTACLVLGGLLLVQASGCAPVGWEASPPPVPQVIEDTYIDELADDVEEEPGGVEEMLEADAAPGPPPDISLLDPAGVDWDLRTYAPGFVAAGLPPAALDQVLHYIGLFHTGRARSNFERWLAREGRYRAFILAELEAAGLPEELLYLSMLESGFSPTAVSRAGAVGLWQFMPATGRESGLRIDDWVDERRDPIAATHAAIGHLTYLYSQLQDWSLAAAAYNAGLGRVNRTRAGSNAGYFDLTLSGRLPAETRSYVPLILAASHVARNRELYGFSDIAAEPALHFDTIHVAGRTRLSALARVADVPLTELTALNTHLVRGAAPPAASYAVRVPAGVPDPEIALRLAALPVDERLLPEYREVYAVVRAGDSWWRIANQHRVTVKDLRARNPRVGDVIHPGMRLLVDRQVVRDSEAPQPRAARAVATSAAPAAAPASATATAGPAQDRAAPAPGAPALGTATPEPQAGGTTYRVRRGDTMSGIAAARRISLADLALWNEMPAPRPLREGELLRVAPPAPRHHQVQRGETLTSVARRYGVGINDLVRWNDLSSARPLREGEVLQIEGATSRGEETR
jgi:membrane-bound lytic murein transglycosylase D